MPYVQTIERFGNEKMAPQNNSAVNYKLLSKIKSVFFRLAAFFLLIHAFQYWLMIVGFHGIDGVRFDTMETHWRIASSTLGVLLPIVALGLWGMYAWGPAVWFITIIIEFVMYGIYAELFGERNNLILVYLSCLTICLVILLLEKIKKGGLKKAA